MQLVIDADHFHLIVRQGICVAKVSIDIMTADFKAMLVPTGLNGRAKSIVEVFRKLADKGVEIRILHAGVPSEAALLELKRELPERLIIRRCPRLHSKAIIIDSAQMYLGSANLTGAGLGAKADGRRNFEMGIWTRDIPLIDQVSTEFNQLWEAPLPHVQAPRCLPRPARRAAIVIHFVPQASRLRNPACRIYCLTHPERCESG